MKITDKLSGVKTAVLKKVASKDQDARDELFRRRLCYLAGQEMQRWNLIRDSVKIALCFQGKPWELFGKLPRDWKFRKLWDRAEELERARIEKIKAQPLRKFAAKTARRSKRKKVPAVEKFRKLLST